MEIFAKLFGSLLALVYHCFDRIVILGHLPLLTRPENIVHFFRDIHPVEIISKEVLRQRTDDYPHWVEAFARNVSFPWIGPKKESARKTTSVLTLGLVAGACNHPNLPVLPFSLDLIRMTA
jgi:hypothetical protein